MTRTFRIGATLLAASLLAACGEGFSSNTTMADGHIVLDDGVVTLHASGAPDATISANGDFAVDGKAIALQPAQRAELQRYAGGVAAIREHGIATGKAGVALAGKSIANAVVGSKAEATANAGSEQVKQAAMKICDDMETIRAAQGQLASGLPAFAPYARLIGADDVERCRKDDDDKR